MSSVPPPQTTPPTPRPLRVTDRRPDEPPWPSWTVLAAVGLGVGGSICAGIVIAIIARAAGASVVHPGAAVSLTEDLVFDLSFVGAAMFFGLLQARARLADFGFRPTSVRRGVAAFLIAGVGYYVLTAVYATVFHLHGKDKLPSELGVSKSTVALVAAAVFVCVIAPIAEEFFFRGFVFGALRRWRIKVAGRELGTVLAAIVTGIFFGAVHAGSASPQYLVPLGFLGFVLCLVRWKTGSLYPCMALHSFNNSLALGVNQLHWNIGPIIGLIVAALAVIGVLVGPLGAREPHVSPS
jgi:uncharacterized protein